MRNQLDGVVIKTHAKNLRKSNKEKWEIPRDGEGRVVRKDAYVVPPIKSDSRSAKEDIPLDNRGWFYRNEAEDSLDKKDIPLMELMYKSRAQELDVRSSSCSDSTFLGKGRDAFTNRRVTQARSRLVMDLEVIV